MDTYSHVMPTLQRDSMARLDALLGNRVEHDERGGSGFVKEYMRSGVFAVSSAVNAGFLLSSSALLWLESGAE